jgi:hypothetical protein
MCLRGGLLGKLYIKKINVSTTLSFPNVAIANCATETDADFLQPNFVENNANTKTNHKKKTPSDLTH